MSDFLGGLLRRSRAPVPEAVRPLPRTLFDPAAQREAPLEATATDETGDGLLGSPGAHAGREAHDDTRSRSRPTAPERPPRSTVERAPGALGTPIPIRREGSRASRQQDDDARPVVEPQRTVMIPSPAAAAQRPPAAAGSLPARDRDTPEAAAERPPPPAARAPERRYRPSSPAPPAVHAAPGSAGEPHPGHPSFGVVPHPILAAPGASEDVAGRAQDAPSEGRPGQPRNRRRGPVELEPLRPARSAADSARAEAPGNAVPKHAADGPPVVRVTIGRVEVRVVSPPARPQAPPAPRPRQPSLSLGDYLAQRGEGRR